MLDVVAAPSPRASEPDAQGLLVQPAELFYFKKVFGDV